MIFIFKKHINNKSAIKRQVGGDTEPQGSGWHTDGGHLRRCREYDNLLDNALRLPRVDPDERAEGVEEFDVLRRRQRGAFRDDGVHHL